MTEGGDMGAEKGRVLASITTSVDGQLVLIAVRHAHDVRQ